MSAVVDHLSADHEIRVLRGFADAEGRRHLPGERWILRRLDFDVAAMSLTFEIERDDGSARFTIDLADPGGPRNGRMREWFEIGARRPPRGGGPAAGTPDAGSAPGVPPDLAPVARLAREERLDEAQAALRTLVGLQQYSGESLPLLAEALEMAASDVLPFSRRGAEWLYAQAINCWYGWGSLATSGGDGAARLPSIRAALQRQAALLGDRA